MGVTCSRCGQSSIEEALGGVRGAKRQNSFPALLAVAIGPHLLFGKPIGARFVSEQVDRHSDPLRAHPIKARTPFIHSVRVAGCSRLI